MSTPIVLGTGSVAAVNPASQMGPRGCEPLARPRASRIATGQGDWGPLTIAQFTITSSPQRIATTNPNRAYLFITSRLIGDIEVFIAPTRAALLLAIPAWTIALSAVLGQKGYIIQRSEFPVSGGLSSNEWWASAIIGMGMATVNVTQQDYFG